MSKHKLHSTISIGEGSARPGHDRRKRFRVEGVLKSADIVLARFPGGMIGDLPKTASLRDGDCMTLEARQAEDAPISYIGRRYNDDSTGICKYAIAIADKTAETVRVLEIPDAFAMEWNLAKELPKDKEEEIDKQETLTAEQRSAKKLELVEMFGSKQSRRRMKVAGEAVIKTVGGMIEETAGETMAKAATMEDIIIPMFNNIPPLNINAANLEDIFDLYKLIPQAEYNELDPEYLKDNSSLPEFVLERMSNLEKSENVEVDTAVLLMIVYLLRLYHMENKHKANRVDLLAKELDCPEIIAEGCQKRFHVEQINEKGKRVLKRTKEKEDLLILWILSLCLMFEGYTFSPMSIANDLGMSISKIKKYFSVIGAKVDAKSKKDPIVWVDLPLKLSTTKIGGRRALK